MFEFEFEFECKGTVKSAPLQSLVCGISYTHIMVYHLPSPWDCGIRGIAVPLHSNSLQPEMVSVQVNEEFADADDWERIQLKEGDKVDFLYFMGGGSELRIKS